MEIDIPPKSVNMKLDIGCGMKKFTGCIGVDISPFKGVDVVWDLRICPWPFEDDAFDEIYAYNVLEHLPDLVQAMQEIHRISKPNSVIHISVPHYRHRIAYSCAHLTFFTDDTFMMFTEEYNTWMTSVRFKILKFDYIFTRVGFFARLLPRKIVRVLNSYINNLIVEMRIDLETVKRSGEEINYGE